MPQIPRYSQQAGGVVQFPTTSLPKLSSAPFEQAALSQAAATQDVLGAVSDVAANFEKKRQEAEFFNLEQEFRKKINDETFALVTSDTSQSVDEWLPVSEKYTTTLASELDSVSGISSTLKARLKNGMLGIASSRLYDGKKNSFDRDIANKSELTNQNVNSIVKDAADADGQEIETPQGRISKSEIILADALSLVERGVDLGYDLDIVDEKGLRFAVDAEILNRKIELDDSSIQSYVEVEQNILNGIGKYALYNLNERRDLAAEVSSHINQMELIRASEIRAQVPMMLDVMSRAVPSVDEDGTVLIGAVDKKNNILSDLEAMAVELERMGDPVGAADIRFKSQLADEIYSLNDEISFKSPEYIAGKLSEFEDAVDVAAKEGVLAEAEAMERLDAAKKLISDREEQLRDNPVAYIVGQHSRVSKQPITPSAIVNYQVEMGVPDFSIKVLTNEQVTNLQETVNTGDIEEAFGSLNALFSSADMNATVKIDGDDFKVGNLAMRQMRAAGLTLGANIAASNPAHPRAKNLLEVSRMSSEDFKAMTSEITDSQDDSIRLAVEESLLPYKTSYVGDFSNNVIDETGMNGRFFAMAEVQEDIEKFAKFLYANGMDDADKAAKVASSIILDQFAFAEIASYDSDSSIGTIRVPRDKQSSVDDIAFYLGGEMRTQVPTQNIDLPADWVRYYPTEEAARERYVQEIQRGGRWITNDDNTGVYLVNQLGNPVTYTKDGEQRIYSLNYDRIINGVAQLKKNPDLLQEFTGEDVIEFGETPGFVPFSGKPQGSTVPMF